MESLTVPRTAIRIGVALQIGAMFVLLVAVNYFSFNHYARADFSRSQKFVLADQTRRVLRDLKKPVQVTVFFSRTYLSPETQLFPDVQNLLKEMMFSSRNKVQVEYVDPTRDLSRARELQGQYKFSADENVIILEYEGRVKFLPVAEMADFDLNGLASGDRPRLIAFRGEQAFTNALIALMNPENLKAYFLTGHGEPPVQGLTPVSVFKDYIERQNVTVAPLSLASADAIPADCATLVIVAPQTDLDEREALILRKYFRNKGRILVLLDPKVNAPRLRGVLQEAGILPLNNRVLRTVRLPFATGILRDVTAEYMPGNAVTKRLIGTLLLPGATQSLEFVPGRVQEIQIWPLLRAAEEFWGESEYVTDEKTGVRYDDGKDAGQPVYVAAAAARGGVSDDRVEVESAKLIAVGNCEFAFDAALNQQGLDFLLSAMNWLLDRGQLAGVMPKTVQNFSLNLTDRQLGEIAVYTMIVIPGAAALLGIIAWWRRRS
ncbi:MAG TPA: GldG family protein [Terrimicrobiaceae bacterium]|nr:GldG family protein [Terrimicrobiaceae bacterium]